MKHEINNEKGITLMALVITIIILLILSTVTITAIVGDHGIISQSKKIETDALRKEIVGNISNDIQKAGLDGTITDEIIEKIFQSYGEPTYDEDGNLSGLYPDEIPDEWIAIEEVYADYTSPVMRVTPTSDTNWGKYTSVRITLSDSASGLSELNSYEYFISEEAQPESAGTLETYTSGVVFRIEGTGKYYLFVKQVTDEAGNTSTAGTEITIDGIEYRRFGPYWEDNTEPTATIKLESVIGTTNGITTTAIVTHTDSNSGINTDGCKYIYNSTSGEYGTTNSIWSDATSFSSNPQTISLTSSSFGNYLHVLTVDQAGNRTESVIATVAIGDYVEYSSGTVSYTSTIDKNGSGSYTFSSYTGTWQVLGADETTGGILIISTNSVGDLGLSGQTGYENCETELEYIGSLYATGTGASGGRSVTVEDINKITGYDPDSAGYASGTVRTYGNDVTFTKNSSTGYIDFIGSIYPKTLTASNTYDTFIYYTGSEWTTLTSGKSVTLTSEAYVYYPTTLTEEDDLDATTGISASSAEYSLLFPYVYWLGSRCVAVLGEGTANFAVRRVSSSNIGYVAQLLAYGDSEAHAYAVRPVVTLDTSISLTPSGTNDWSISQ